MAYAAIILVKQTIRGLLNGSDQSLIPDGELKSINDGLCSVQSILESVSYLEGGERDDASRKEIKFLASELEDLISFRTSECSRDESLTRASSQELLRVKQQLIDHAKTLKTEKCQQPSETLNTEEKQQPSGSFAADVVPVRTGFGWNNEMVGLVTELIQIQNWLLHDSEQLDVISIVGRSGIGKTTLAKKIYEDQHVSSKFSQKFFVTIGQKYELKEFLLYLIDHMGICIPGIQLRDDIEIGVFLHRHLVGRKYLIVLDDIRNSLAWEKVKNLFQNDGKSGSRIILTTTQQDVAGNASTNQYFLKVPFLNEDQSWTLLKQIIFTTGEACPFQLEKLGKKIAKNCDGLPRAIVSTANSLRNTRTVEYWSRVSEDTFLLSTTRDDSTFLEAYNQLPQHLKECFLYMGVFPPNYDIPTSKLLKLWAAEGLVRPQEGKPLEETAREYLNDLVSRNLVSVCKQSSRGRTKTCRIHFLDRKVCVREAKRENFFHVISKYEDSLEEGLKSQSRLCIYNNVVLALKDVHSAMEEYTAEVHSLLCVGPQHQHWLPVYLSFMMLKVLDALTIRFHEFPLQVLQLVELKYLAITYDRQLPAPISKLQNLEVLIVHRFQRVRLSDSSVYLPVEIWTLRKLKHLECTGFELPDPANGINNSLLLEELLTLAGVSVHSCRQGVFAGIPKLSKLRIWVESTGDAAEAFSFFCNSTGICPALDSFKCNVVIRGPPTQVASPIPAFPGAENLKKITLSRCGFSWEHMKIIGGLPNLEVLKVRCYAFRGSEWETKLGEFLKLKFLLLEDLDIEQWTLNDDYEDWETGYEQHFPELEHLIFRHCYSLVEIPENIIDFPALQTIELDNCSGSVTALGRELEKEREESGNNEPQFRIHCAFCG